MHMSEYVRTGLSLDQRTVDRLDEIAAIRDKRVAHVVSRSEIARDVLPVGLTAFEYISDAIAETPNHHVMSTIVRQALQDFEFETRGERDVLLEALADREGVDPDELEQAIMRLQLDG